MTEPHSFGAWLRRERERRTITLRAIADQTKIGARRLEALERGDISQWPGGIYRRAFVRAYADAVGLDADLVLANFERAFPTDPSVAPAAVSEVVAGEESEMRLALVAPALPGVTRSAVRTALRDLSCVAGAGLAGLAVFGAVGFWCAAAVVAMALHVAHVLGLHRISFRRHAADPSPQPAETRAEVLSFYDLSAASSAALPRRRRAARS